MLRLRESPKLAPKYQFPLHMRNGITSAAGDTTAGNEKGRKDGRYSWCSGSSVSTVGALRTEVVSSLQRPLVRFHLQPFAECHLPTLSPPFPAVMSKSNNNKKKIESRKPQKSL